MREEMSPRRKTPNKFPPLIFWLNWLSELLIDFGRENWKKSNIEAANRTKRKLLIKIKLVFCKLLDNRLPVMPAIIPRTVYVTHTPNT